jgi:peptidylprolyl isomerase
LTLERPEIGKPEGDIPFELGIEDLEIGDGEEATAGSKVSVHYVGVSFLTGEEFDASWNRDQPFEFKLGKGQVIPGWDAGVQGMRVGGRRKGRLTDRSGGPGGREPRALHGQRESAGELAGKETKGPRGRRRDDLDRHAGRERRLHERSCATLMPRGGHEGHARRLELADGCRDGAGVAGRRAGVAVGDQRDSRAAPRRLHQRRLRGSVPSARPAAQQDRGRALRHALRGFESGGADRIEALAASGRVAEHRDEPALSHACSTAASRRRACR